MSDGGWISAHLFHHGDLDQVLTGLVDPLAEEMRERALADRCFFLRYWDGGPHIRLRVLPKNDAVRDDVRRLIEHRAAAYFARCPAPDVLTQEEYLASAQEIGAWEGVVPTERMYTNNSVHFLPYQREHHRYGRGRTVETVEEHFAESSTLALAQLRSGAGRQRRETAVLCCLLIAWLLGSADVPDLARRQLAKAGPRGSGQAALYERQRDQVLALAATMRRSAWERRRLSSDGGTLWRWTSSLTRVVDALNADATAPSAESAADLCAHLFANRVGVRVDTEGVLRYLAARAVTDPDGPQGE
ncbi:thiopeptide-type bacteriocin biosynthesis protein [Streptomyces montanus]|uniref:thiopeptide-type bacteriocin biosynthesis protein n=1 Tax=Streptomyces montanus TaxID=2580423 RepID=UPI0014865A0C|nr:thiopeptide-type bacteriocin biosynthesis protein [Streptomyces montanus]